MAAPFSPQDLNKLKFFIDFVEKNPLILNSPQLEFVKKFIEKFGGKLPEGEFTMPPGAKCPFGGDAQQENTKESPTANDYQFEDISEMEVDSEDDSELELDMEGVIEPDTDANQSMGDSSKTPTEEEIDKAGELRSQAAIAYSEQKYQQALDLYTQAIEMNPGNALFYAKRGQTYLKLLKPNCCIRDCNKALEINCDSAAAYKFRGRAHRLLGNWENAAKDLRQACKIDFDEETDEWLREVTPNAKKIEQHRIKQQRKKVERERKAAEAKRQKDGQQQEQRQQQKNDKTQGEFRGGSAGSFPGGFPGAFPGGVFNKETINLADLGDPEFFAAFEDVLKDGSNISKYASNPKFAKLISTFKNIYKGGMPGAFSGDTPADLPGEATDNSQRKSEEGTKPTAAKVPDFADDGLD